MAEVPSDNDPFYMTFGKEKWDQTNLNKGNTPKKQFATNKKPKKMFGYEINTERPKRSLQTQNKKPVCLRNSHKENIETTERIFYRTKAMSSLTDRQPKQLLDVETIRQQMQKKYSNAKQSRPGRQSRSMFDNELNKRLKDIETAAKAKISRIRNLNEGRKFDSLYEPEIILDKYKLIGLQKGKMEKLTTVDPSINRYREEMVKLDTLIQRVNAKIDSSATNHTINLVKRYAFEKV